MALALRDTARDTFIVNMHLYSVFSFITRKTKARNAARGCLAMLPPAYKQTMPTRMQSW